MLPPPAGEGWGGGSKVKIIPFRSIFDTGFDSRIGYLQGCMINFGRISNNGGHDGPDTSRPTRSDLRQKHS